MLTFGFSYNDALKEEGQPNYHSLKIKLFKPTKIFYESNILYFSFMDLTGLLTSCSNAVRNQNQLSSLVSMLPALLVLSLCGCMLWQCSTCLLKYFAFPTGANVAFSQDLSQSPISITICNKGEDLDYNFPELGAVDVKYFLRSEWQTVWLASGTHSNVSVTEKNFVSMNSQGRLSLCKTIHVHESKLSELRLRHYYSDDCKQNKMEVHLHNQGLFLSPSHNILIPKTIFTGEENFILELSLGTMISLPSAEFNCSQEDETAETLDSCLLAEAMKAANLSAGCLSKSLR